MSGRILAVVTHAMTADLLLRGQLGFLRERGWEVGLVAAPDPRLREVEQREGCQVFPVSMARKIAPLGDLKAVIRSFAPDIVVSSTPKAGLLGTLAARSCGIRARVYVVRGLRLETARGWRRALLLAAERRAAAAATDIVCVGESLRARYVELGLAKVEPVVLGEGSSNGVDTVRFAPTGVPEDVAQGVGPVIGFVGRLTRDKGIEDLALAFDRVRQAAPGTKLLLVGDFEVEDPVPADVRAWLVGTPDVEVTGFVDDTAPYYRRMTVLAFPSAREGFPNAPLEAAASGVPCVGYRVTGTVDAVVDGATGSLVEPGDVAALAGALSGYLSDPELRRQHGAAARSRALDHFRREDVWERWADFYRGLLP